MKMSISEVIWDSGRERTIRFKLNDKEISVPVGGDVYAYFQGHFTRTNPTPLQRRRYKTLINIIRAAYQKGFRDAKAA
jgi:hypothetical protein